MDCFVISCELRPPTVFCLPMKDAERMVEVYNGVILPYKFMATQKRGSDTIDVHGVTCRKMRKWMTTKDPKILKAGDDFLLRLELRA